MRTFYDPGSYKSQYKPRHERRRDVRSVAIDRREVTEEEDDARQNDEANRRAAAINCHAAEPLPKIIAFGFKDQPLVCQKSHENTQQPREHAGRQIAVFRPAPAEQESKRARKYRYPEDSISAADENISEKLSRWDVGKTDAGTTGWPDNVRSILGVRLQPEEFPAVFEEALRRPPEQTDTSVRGRPR